MTNDQRMTKPQGPMRDAGLRDLYHWSLGIGYSLVIDHWTLCILSKGHFRDSPPDGERALRASAR
jgi:hypothetical protein